MFTLISQMFYGKRERISGGTVNEFGNKFITTFEGFILTKDQMF